MWVPRFWVHVDLNLSLFLLLLRFSCSEVRAAFSCGTRLILWYLHNSLLCVNCLSWNISPQKNLSQLPVLGCSWGFKSCLCGSSAWLFMWECNSRLGIDNSFGCCPYNNKRNFDPVVIPCGHSSMYLFNKLYISRFRTQPSDHFYATTKKGKTIFSNLLCELAHYFIYFFLNNTNLTVVLLTFFYL